MHDESYPSKSHGNPRSFKHSAPLIPTETLELQTKAMGTYFVGQAVAEVRTV